MSHISKAAVLYLHRAGGDYSCANCCLYLATTRRCMWFSARDLVQPFGGCGLFVQGTKTLGGETGASPLGKVTPLEAGYVENRPGFTCGRCKHWLGNALDCEKVDKDSPGDDTNVDVGTIEKDACCNEWSARAAGVNP